MRRDKINSQKHLSQEIFNSLPENVAPYVKQTTDKAASAWLNVMPIQEKNLNLNKQEFRDALRIRYDMKLANLPSKCVCGEMFSMDHALICKKGGLISKRHDNVRDLLTVLLNKVCVDVQSELHLTPIETETVNLRSPNTNHDSRLDVKDRGFWTHDQTAFSDIRVTHVGSQSNQNRDTNTVF